MKNTISNNLILISIFFTILIYIYPDLEKFGMNRYFLESGNYYYYFLQFFTSNFIHGGLLHIFFNSIFIYYFGNLVEIIVGKKKFIAFFIFNVFFVGLGITYFSGLNSNTVGISGFCMALITYYTLELKSKKHPDWTGGVTAIILNLLIGLNPGISLVGHFFGFIAGILFYLYNKEYLRRIMIPILGKN